MDRTFFPPPLACKVTGGYCVPGNGNAPRAVPIVPNIPNNELGEVTVVLVLAS